MVDVRRAGEGRMRIENVSGARVLAPVAKSPQLVDSDLLTSVRYGLTSPRGYLYLFARASGDWVRTYAGSAYFLQLINNDGAAQLWKSSSGASTAPVWPTCPGWPR